MEARLLLRARQSNNSAARARPRNVNHFRTPAQIDSTRSEPADRGWVHAPAIFQSHAEKWRVQVDRLGIRTVTI